MNTPNSQITFDSSVPMAEVESTLRLALLAAECLHGEDRVRMETSVEVCMSKRTCVIETASEVGRAVAVLFAGYVRREFGDDMVRVERVESSQRHLVETS